MKHTDYQTIVEAAQGLTGTKAKTRQGAWRALQPWLKARPIIGSGRAPYTGIDQHDVKYIAEKNKISVRAGYYLAQWRSRADRGAEKIMRAAKLKSRWDDLNSNRPRDPFNRALAKTRRGLDRDSYGALYIATQSGQRYGDNAGEEGFRRVWLASKNAEPAGLSAAWECVRAIERGADEHGGWEQRSQWDKKGRGEQVTVDLYGIDAAANLYIIQVRQSFRERKNYYLSIRKAYFMVGYNENGNPFAHPISAAIVHGAIKRDPSPASPVRAAQAWIWGIDEKCLPAILRNGDVALIPARGPGRGLKTNDDIFSAGEYRVDDAAASDHHIIADKIIFNGAIYALNPILYHRKGQHPAAQGDGWYKVVVGRRADFWDFARPTID